MPLIGQSTINNSHEYTVPTQFYIQKYAAMIAENREKMYADKLNMDAAPHVSAIPEFGVIKDPVLWQLARLGSLPLHMKENPWLMLFTALHKIEKLPSP